jgi:hypothetical protein
VEHSLRRPQFTSQRVVLAVIATGILAGCAPPPAALTQLMEARRLASDLHVEFTKAAEAANRAVMADTDEASAAAAEEAKRARQAVERDMDALRPILESLGYREDLRQLEAFKGRFEEYRRLDDEILPLAVENTNLKAQRLSFGPAREAADSFRSAVDAAVRPVPAKDSSRARELAAIARIAVLEILALQAPHIAEPRDDIMTRLEEQMKTSAASARKTLTGLQAVTGRAGASQVAAATTALDGFLSINDQIVALSRRNTNVRSLALSLGRKRAVTAECEDQLKALEEALAKHAFTATR